MVYLYDRGLERRWLWGVYAVLFLLPFILVSVFFCPETGPLFKVLAIRQCLLIRTYYQDIAVHQIH